MTIVYRNAGAWGGGKGAPLSASEIDGNFYDLVGRLTALQDNPPEPTKIQEITLSGTQFTVALTDGSNEGPFDLPFAVWTWRDQWQATTNYSKLDIFYVEENGLYVVLQDHTSATEFDALENNTDGFYYAKVMDDTSVYDLHYFMPGMPAEGFDAGTPILQIVSVRSFVLPQTTTEISAGRAYVRVASTETEDFEAIIRKNGTQIGTVDIPTGANNGTIDISANTSFVAGDILSIDQPTGAGIIEDLSIIIAAIRGA